MVGMALTQIEQFAFGGNCAHFATTFEVDAECVTLRLKPVESDATLRETIVRFPSARMLNDWTANEQTQWPLDIIGFDCYPQLERWKFPELWHEGMDLGVQQAHAGGTSRSITGEKS